MHLKRKLNEFLIFLLQEPMLKIDCFSILKIGFWLEISSFSCHPSL